MKDKVILTKPLAALASSHKSDSSVLPKSVSYNLSSSSSSSSKSSGNRSNRSSALVTSISLADHYQQQQQKRQQQQLLQQQQQDLETYNDKEAMMVVSCLKNQNTPDTMCTTNSTLPPPLNSTASSSSSSSSSSSFGSSKQTMTAIISSSSSQHYNESASTAVAIHTSQQPGQPAQTHRPTQLFFTMIANSHIWKSITKHVLTRRSIFSERLSYRPMQCQRYNQINSAEWMMANDHFGLLLDKMKTQRPPVFNQRALIQLAGKCRSAQTFHLVFQAKREYFCNDTALVEAAIEGGNLTVVQYMMDEQHWLLPPTALELAARAGHIDVLDFLIHRRQPLPPNTVPALFKIALQHNRLAMARHIFGKIGFFLSGPVDQFFRLLCCMGDFAFFKLVYESLQLVLASTALKEYLTYLSDLLNYQTTPLTREHIQIISYIERGNGRTTLPPISATMSDAAMYSLFIRWINLNRPQVVGTMSNSILRTAVFFDDAELYAYTVKTFPNAHPCRHMQLACSQGAHNIVQYLIENQIEPMTHRSIQLAYFGRHNTRHQLYPQQRGGHQD
ncbi:hypothetical protein SAMD00019534_003930 [Acytostelium subglobosum LB1]|uniref:hypothetical protein n=1 Tax=Acytostelium subglobosum LB1 TaxID=1410327 RepID=UPI000644CAB4|nr:hypothetical protein SAMD00019534_003930 [Acytostelium subglobosum LB1]GAM17218.1 hypothetical protein SAMD00019534_003930 [Acytostelium subglobosum LB1]|eukprot:XP_012759280.1 hypothetical protein SAMD00019534_003930 [Acytostelium subglobosum LB1]